MLQHLSVLSEYINFIRHIFHSCLFPRLRISKNTHFAEYFNNSEDIIGNGDIKKTDVTPLEIRKYNL